MSTPANGTPPPAAILAGYYAAHEAEGYITEGGEVDRPRVREQIYAVLAPRKVITWAEREGKAITVGALVLAVFPALTPPSGFAAAGNPALAEAVWAKVRQAFASDLRPSANGPMQHLVGSYMGNGYVLCRSTTVGADRTPAYYVTDDRACIVGDYLDADNAALRKRLETNEANIDMLMHRQPTNARSYMRSHERHLKSITTSGHARLLLALEAATADPGADADDPDAEAS